MQSKIDVLQMYTSVGLHTTSESPYMTSESSSGQGLRYLLIGKNSVNGGFHEIVVRPIKKMITFGGRYLLCTGYLFT